MHISISAALAARNDLLGILDDSDPITPHLPELTRGTIAGILVAISGNILISLALNCQKLAHKRLEKERESRTGTPRSDEIEEEGGDDGGRPQSEILAPPESTRGEIENGSVPVVAVVETEPLLGATDRESSYGTPAIVTKPTILSRFSRRYGRDVRNIEDADETHLASAHALIPVDVIPARIEQGSDGQSKQRRAELETSDVDMGNESDYLKSKLWWTGFLLMNIGEMGNFISYAFAPASVVAPLGTFALIANCIFAPLMLKERFRNRDFLGILIAIIGAVTVVLSSNPSDVRLDPQGLIQAITQRPFVAYSIIYIVGIVVLAGLSEGTLGKRWVYVDVGLCALFGGFTVLSTKAISTLLTLEWFEIFTEWITYPVIAILIFTGVGQIKYLNRALMRFDSKIVVPTQFVMFNLSAIIGSAILYQDFRKATFHQLVTFLYGCAATFAGVFVIAWAPTGGDEVAELSPSESESDRNEYSMPDAGGEHANGSTIGSVGRRRPKLIIEPGTPILRNRQSVVSLYGLSPAQRVLIINTPPRDEPVSRSHSQDVERDGLSSPDAIRRRRAISWVGDGQQVQGTLRVPASSHGTRNSSRARQQDALSHLTHNTGQSPPAS